MADRRADLLRPRRRVRLAAATAVLMTTGLLALSSTTQMAPVKNTLAAPRACRPAQDNCKPSPTPTHDPTPCYTPIPPYFVPCTSPTPDSVVISPVAPDPRSPAVTPPYLVGLPPSPSNSPSDVGGAIAPLGGGTTDNLPSPGAGGGGAETVKSNGLPVPFLLAMLVLASIGGGFLLWRFGPRGKRLPDVRPAPPILFTPYGSESRTTANLLDPSVNLPPD